MTRLLMTFTTIVSLTLGLASCKGDVTEELQIPAMPDIAIGPTVYKNDISRSYVYLKNVKSKAIRRPLAEEVFGGNYYCMPSQDYATYEKYIDEVISIAKGRQAQLKACLKK